MRGWSIGCIYLVLAGCDGLGPHADRALRSAVMASEPTEINRREGDTWVSSRDGGQTLTVVLPGRAETVVELQVGGRDIGGPFTSGHTSEVTVSLDLTPASADWDMLAARLPCGTHDNHCTTANGRVFVVEGAHPLPRVSGRGPRAQRRPMISPTSTEAGRWWVASLKASLIPPWLRLTVESTSSAEAGDAAQRRFPRSQSRTRCRRRRGG